MKIIETDIKEVIVLQPSVFPDDRGYFYEVYNSKNYFDAGVKAAFVQDNISKSNYGAIRGLHYQVGEFAQGKLCKVIKGKVLDVAVDIRFGSPTFGKYVAAEPSDENHHQIWIPPGFAHGFSVLSEEVIFMYKCTALYSKASERAIKFNDTYLNIDWGIENPVVSEKDLLAKNFKDIEKDFIY